MTDHTRGDTFEDVFRAALAFTARYNRAGAPRIRVESVEGISRAEYWALRLPPHPSPPAPAVATLDCGCTGTWDYPPDVGGLAWCPPHVRYARVVGVTPTPATLHTVELP